MGLFIFARLDEVFHLHLLELARAKDEVAGRYFVPERLSNLGHAKGQLAAAGVQDIQKIDEDSLGGLRPQIHQRIRIVFSGSAGMRLKHQIERPRLRQIL